MGAEGIYEPNAGAGCSASACFKRGRIRLGTHQLFPFSVALVNHEIYARFGSNKFL
jgi:hypothetical protein